MGWWNISLGLPCGCSCLRPVLLWTSEQSWSSSLAGLLSIRLYVCILFILLQIVWQPVALENPNSLMSEISTKTQEAEGILVREREELGRIANKIHNVLMNHCQNFQGRKRKWQYDDQTVPSFHPTIQFIQELVVGIKLLQDFILSPSSLGKYSNLFPRLLSAKNDLLFSLICLFSGCTLRKIFSHYAAGLYLTSPFTGQRPQLHKCYYFSLVTNMLLMEGPKRFLPVQHH